MTEHKSSPEDTKSRPEVTETEGPPHSKETHNQYDRYKKFAVRGADGPWDAMRAEGVPEAGEAYGPEFPNMIVVGRSARAMNGNPDDCDEWEVTVRYSDRGESEDRIRRSGRKY